MQEIIITMENIYVLNVISSRKEMVIIDIEELARKILKFECDYYWYETVDEIGNINADPELLKKAQEDTISLLENHPDVIINMLQSDIEEIECTDDYCNNQEWRDAKDIIENVEELKNQQSNYEIEL